MCARYEIQGEVEGAGTGTMMKYGDSGEYGNKGWGGHEQGRPPGVKMARSSMQLAKQTVGTFASQVHGNSWKNWPGIESAHHNF